MKTPSQRKTLSFEPRLFEASQQFKSARLEHYACVWALLFNSEPNYFNVASSADWYRMIYGAPVVAEPPVWPPGRGGAPGFHDSPWTPRKKSTHPQKNSSYSKKNVNTCSEVSTRFATQKTAKQAWRSRKNRSTQKIKITKKTCLQWRLGFCRRTNRFFRTDCLSHVLCDS